MRRPKNDLKGRRVMAQDCLEGGYWPPRKSVDLRVPESPVQSDYYLAVAMGAAEPAMTEGQNQVNAVSICASPARLTGPRKSALA
jgi:hypothetical protein